jgi:hypothetical protein
MSQSPKKRTYDSMPFGAIAGILAPLIFLVAYYLTRYHGMRVGAFLRYLSSGSILIPTASLCVFVGNLLVFFIFIWTDRDKSSRGVVLTTILITIVVGILKSLGK